MKPHLSHNTTGTIDHEKSNTMRKLLSDDFELLIHAFLDSATSIIKLLPAAVENQDAKEAVRLVHSLKSAGANVGATTLSTLAYDAENTIRSLDLNDLTLFTNRIKAEYKRVQAELKNNYKTGY